MGLPAKLTLPFRKAGCISPNIRSAKHLGLVGKWISSGSTLAMARSNLMLVGWFVNRSQERKPLRRRRIDTRTASLRRSK